AQAAEHDGVQGVIGCAVPPPPRWRRWRSLRPEPRACRRDAGRGVGAAASLRRRSGLSPPVANSWPATPGPTPSSALTFRPVCATGGRPRLSARAISALGTDPLLLDVFDDGLNAPVGDTYDVDDVEAVQAD